MMRQQRHLLYFLIPTCIAWIAGGFFLLQFSKEKIHLTINGWQADWADWFFLYWTYLGEGWLFLLAIPLAFFVSARSGIQFAFAGLFTGLFTGIFKQLLFSGEPRPIKFFEGIADLYLVPGSEENLWNSFPSGHTLAAFCLYFSLAIIFKRKGLSLFFFAIAFLVGYSRMYLSQHFLVDVVAGSGLGVLCAILANFVAQKFSWKILDKPILKMIK